MKGETIVVVCTLRRGEQDDDDLRAAISRRVVRAAWLGLDPGDLSALDDPTTIEAIRRAGPNGAVAGGG